MNKQSSPTLVVLVLNVILFFLLAGCSSSPTKTVHGVSDPFEPMNRSMFKFNQSFNRAVARPIAGGYRTVMPDPGEKGVRNFFRNLELPYIILNDFLQFDLKHTFKNSGRFVVNTTIGLAGLFDPAKKMGMPYRHQNFGLTLAKWKVPSGPYLMLPFFGPHTVRSLPNIPMSIATNPIAFLNPGATQVFLTGMSTVDALAAEQENIARIEEAVSPYALVREGYILQQNRLINRGKDTSEDIPFEPLPPELLLEEDEEDDAAALGAEGIDSLPPPALQADP